MESKKISCYSTKEIAEITAMAPRRVTFYTDQGVVTPEVDVGAGRGKVRRYSFHNLLQFQIIKCLADLGMTISKVKLIINYLDKHNIVRQYEEHKLHEKGLQLFIKLFPREDGKTAAGWTLISDESDTLPVLKPSEMTDFETCVIINFARIVDTVNKK
jgi:DNA-binding transcriptional MerR regulator